VLQCVAVCCSVLQCVAVWWDTKGPRRSARTCEVSVAGVARTHEKISGRKDNVRRTSLGCRLPMNKLGKERKM